MVHRFSIFVLGFLSAAAASAARAENVIVIPGRPDVPVIINYYDARWRVVEGEEGLNRPGHVVPNVIGGRFVGPIRAEFRRRGYYPTSGEKPVQGRLEIEPPADRQLPQPAESVSRSWSSNSSEPVPPADLPNPNSGMMGEGNPLPPVIVAPQFGPRRGH